MFYPADVQRVVADKVSIYDLYNEIRHGSLQQRNAVPLDESYIQSRLGPLRKINAYCVPMNSSQKVCAAALANRRVEPPPELLFAFQKAPQFAACSRSRRLRFDLLLHNG